MKVEKGQKIDWAQIIFNSLCSELDWWYKYIKENKGDKKYTYQSALVLAKIFQYLFVHQKENPHKSLTKVERTREEMQIALENRKKVIVDSPKSALKRKNKIGERRALGSRMKREQESTYLRAQKMMRGKVEPSTMPTMVRAMSIVV
jgi:hypothetical protein